MRFDEESERSYGMRENPDDTPETKSYLPHLHDEALQIPGFRHAGEDGMVGALAS